MKGIRDEIRRTDKDGHDWPVFSRAPRLAALSGHPQLHPAIEEIRARARQVWVLRSVHAPAGGGPRTE
jgi:hypothetical protein